MSNAIDISRNVSPIRDAEIKSPEQIKADEAASSDGSIHQGIECASVTPRHPANSMAAQ